MLLQFAIKTYDLVVALTGGGPGLASTLPTVVVYDFMFQRGELARGSAAAVMLLARWPSCWCPTGCIARGSSARQRHMPDRVTLSRVAIHAMLIAFAAFFLVPLLVVVLNSLRSTEDINHAGVIGLPQRAGLEQLQPDLEQLLHLPALQRHPAVFLELDADGDPRNHHLHAARRAERLFAVAVAVPRRQRSCSAS